MQPDELLSLPVHVDLATACRALGIGRSLGYELISRDEFPCRVRRLGRLYRVVTRGPDGLLAACGFTPEARSSEQVDPDELI